jgi:subtilisin family serine protease
MPPVIVAVIDTGISSMPVPPTRLVAGMNLSLEGPEDDTVDRHGHGTAIACTILECSETACVLPVKLIGDYGSLCHWDQLEIAFEWVLRNFERLGIRVVCAPFADASHSISDANYRNSRFQRQVAALRDAAVPVVAPAGNWYANKRLYNPHGMAWPAILREVVSVGAVGRKGDAFLLNSRSQRLHRSLDTGCHTTIFAVPGPPGGTSGAAAVITGCLADLRAAQPSASVDGLIARIIDCAVNARDGSDLFWPVFDTTRPNPRA